MYLFSTYNVLHTLRHLPPFTFFCLHIYILSTKLFQSNIQISTPLSHLLSSHSSTKYHTNYILFISHLNTNFTNEKSTFINHCNHRCNPFFYDQLINKEKNTILPVRAQHFTLFSFDQCFVSPPSLAFIIIQIIIHPFLHHQT